MGDSPTARDELIKWAAHGLMMADHLNRTPDHQDKATHMADAYAHELAEYIRDNVGGDGGFPDGMWHAADLIDPQENQ